MSKKRNLMLFAVFCLCLGGIFFWRGTGVRAAEAATTVGITSEELEQIIIEAYQSYKTEVAVEQYDLYDNKDSDMIEGVMEEVINATPYLFYTGREFSKVIVDSTNQIIGLHLTYSSAYMKDGAVNRAKIEKHRRQIDSAVKKALSGIHSKMSDIEKAMLLHDYLIGLVIYDDSQNRPSRLTEVGALLENKANCQGYSVTYQLLLKQAGIEARCFSSQKMNHMWNLVKINSEWYHVDVTWDDPLNARNSKERFGVVLHDNFLLSDKGIRKSGHYDAASGIAKNTRFDNSYWKEITSGFWYQAGNFVYADAKGICTRSTLTGGKTKYLKKLAVLCMVQKSENLYYMITRNQIYLFRIKSGTLKSVYKPPSGSCLLELKYKNNSLMFRYQKKGKIYTKTKKV